MWKPLTRCAAQLALLVPLVSTAAAQDDADAKLREDVLASIDRAQQFLISQQLGNGDWETQYTSSYPVGASALVVLSLLNSGLPTDHPAVDRALQHLRSSPDPDQTYELSMLIMALVAADVDHGRVARLADTLVSFQKHGGGDADGAWYYGGPGAGFGGGFDNSNTQFAILGLREAAMSGHRIDEQVWRDAQAHWMRMGPGFAPPGPGRPLVNGWTYMEDGRSLDGTGSMTVAGIASLTITSGFLRSLNGEGADGNIDCCAVDEEDAAVREVIEGGNRWLAQHFQVRNNPGSGVWLLYYLYGLERAGRLTGTRFYGDNDWYRQGARYLVDTQNVRFGSWASVNEQDPVIGTSLALLFLSKGLSPVLINKLKFGPRHPDTLEADPAFWNVHPRDVSNLTEFISGRDKWPRLVTWQIVDLELAARSEGVGALLQAPVQYIGGSQDLSVFSDQEVALLREYIAQGGFLFAVQECGSADFELGFRELIERMFPDGEFKLERLPDTHDIYRSEFVLTENPPELWGVDVGCRTAIVYAPFDHACRWDRWMRVDPPRRHAAVKTQIARSMQLGVNVVAYATGRELADKLKVPSVVGLDEDDPLNRGRTTIARLRHTGGFDTAPNALQHLRLALHERGIDLSPIAPTIAATDPALFDYPLLYMHGRKNFALSDAERGQLKAYIENGGFLFADACCGAGQFDASFRRLIEQLFGRELERIPLTHELFNNPLAFDIRQVKRRIPGRDAQDALTLQESVGEPVLEGIEVDGRYVVVYSKYDLSCALERQATVSCAGYPTEDAARIGVNIVLYGLYQ